MRATGIVRRIDELGRVVIPKEIRRTLRIREGDPLEIYTDRDGEVILKKYSPIGEMSSFAKDYTESLFRSLGHIAVIVDRDQVVAASGLPRKELGDKPISRALETAIASRQTVALNQQSGGRMVAVTTEEDQNPNYTAQVISPIIADGEAIGAVLLMSRDNGVKMGDTELKVAETAAGIVGRQMEQKKIGKRALPFFAFLLDSEGILAYNGVRYFYHGKDAANGKQIQVDYRRHDRAGHCRHYLQARRCAVLHPPDVRYRGTGSGHLQCGFPDLQPSADNFVRRAARRGQPNGILRAGEG